MSENKEALENLGIQLKRITNAGKTLCPKCSHDRKKKNDPCLSVNIPDGSYNCHNCGWKGRVLTKAIFEKKEYIKPVFNNRTNLSVGLVNWFAGRSINQQTLIDFKVTESVEWMPQIFDQQLTRLMDAGKTKEQSTPEAHKLAKVNTVQFNYFHRNELINVKYRDGKKNFKMAKNAKLIFYNIDSLKDQKECIICEGEIDAMSWAQSGYKAVISVPNGATVSDNQKLEYVDNCADQFDNISKIYLSTDDDVAGHGLRDELARRFGIERCYKVDFLGLKDANEFLVAHGPAKLLDRLNHATVFPITGVFSVEDLWPDVMDIYYNGLPEGDRSGDERFDEYLRFFPGELTIVTGVPSHGKSIFLEQLSINLTINAGWAFGVFSPESFPVAMYILRLIKKITGKQVIPKWISEADMGKMKDWLMDKFNIIYPENEHHFLETILEKARQLVLRKGINGLIIDPWNKIESNLPNNYNEGKFVNEQLSKIIKFCQQNGVHAFLVAHPTKMPKDKQGHFEVPNLYSISGSANFFNMTQNGFTVYRNSETGLTEVHIQKVKWEHLGKKGMIEYRYCHSNTRLLPPLRTRTEESAGFAEGDTKSLIPGIGDNLYEAPQTSQIKPSNLFDIEPPTEDIVPPF
jgi:twinkle protein